MFSDYTKRQILLLQERGKRTKEILELLLKEDIFERVIEGFRRFYRGTSREVHVRTIVRKRAVEKTRYVVWTV